MANLVFFERLAIIGCGMMGGSFALAARRANLVGHIVGFSQSPATTGTAQHLGVINQAADSIKTAVNGADLVLVSVPVAATFGVFSELMPHLKQGALILDLGSTKQSVIAAVIRAFGAMPPQFVPSHPIAGQELSGVEAADVDLYLGKRVILTPTSQTAPQSLLDAEGAWSALGMEISRMTPREHDEVYAAVSHVPHLLAFAYMHAIAGQQRKDQLLRMAGPGFRDFTRIAASRPEVWRDIFLSNRRELLTQLAITSASLKKLEETLSSECADVLQDILAVASEARSSWVLNQKISVDDQ